MKFTFINSHIFGGHDLKVVVVDESIPSLLVSNSMLNIEKCSSSIGTHFDVILLILVVLLYSDLHL